MKKEFKIRNMHCHSCENILEQEVAKIKGVNSVKASLRGKSIVVDSRINVSNKVIETVSSQGYEIIEKKEIDRGFIRGRYLTFISFGIAFLLIVVANFLGLERYFNPYLSTPNSVSSFFVVGLVAGVSSCMALVGGLVLGLATRYNLANNKKTSLQKFRPHIFFNLGRLFSFFILGGLLAEIGGFFLLQAGVVGLMIAFVSLVMIVLGLSLLGVTSRAQKYFRLPDWASKYISIKNDNKEYSHRKALLLGAATFFLPCGFTQAAQVFAISSGNFLTGALVMLFFALGTTPGLLSIGGLSSAIKKGVWGNIFLKTVAFLIIFFAFYNLTSAFNLMNLKPQELLKTKTEETGVLDSARTRAEIIDGVQVIRAVYDPSSDWQYVINPGEYLLTAGIPARLEVEAQEDGSGCMGSITLPGLNGNFYIFEKNKTTKLEFFPDKPGTYKITCAMGVPMGSILVSI